MSLVFVILSAHCNILFCNIVLQYFTALNKKVVFFTFTNTIPGVRLDSVLETINLLISGK